MYRNLTTEEARAHYDRNARRQDAQAWYEDTALGLLTALGDFSRATAVLEAGCGTGRFAETMLARHLPGDAAYTGLDISPAMLARAGRRLEPFAPRVTLKPADVTLGLAARTESFDRAVAAYLFDLLSPAHSKHLVAELHRVLRPGGLLCLASLTPEDARGRRTVLTQLWTLVQRHWPWFVGGCRPVRLRPLVAGGGWETVADETVTDGGLASEVLVAMKT